MPPPPPPHHLKNSTVRIHIPAQVNYEASSSCFDEESQPMAPCNICPENLRFTQDSIKNRFKKPYDHQRIDEAVDQIGNKQLSPAVFMPLTVVDHKSVLWSLDNRRLWVLRKAGVPTVKVVLVPPNFNRRSEGFFSSSNDALVRQYSSANYFPRVRGGVRSVGISRGGAPPPPKPMLLHHPTEVAVAGAYKTLSGIPPPPPPYRLKNSTVRIDIPAEVNYEASSSCFDKESQRMAYYPTTVVGSAQANKTVPNSTHTPPPHLRDITVRSNIPPLVSPLPSASHQPSKNIVSTLSNKNSDPGGKKGSDLWGKVLNVVHCGIDKCVGFFRNEKVVRFGKKAFIFLGFLLGVLVLCYLGFISVKAVVVGMKRMASYLLNKLFCFLRSIDVKAVVVGTVRMVSHLLHKLFRFLCLFVRSAVDWSKGVAVKLGAKDAFSFCLNKIKKFLHLQGL